MKKKLSQEDLELLTLMYTLIVALVVLILYFVMTL